MRSALSYVEFFCAGSAAAVVAAATTAATAAATATTAATAAAADEDDEDQDDPATTAAKTATTVITAPHIEVPPKREFEVRLSISGRLQSILCESYGLVRLFISPPLSPRSPWDLALF